MYIYSIFSDSFIFTFGHMYSTKRRAWVLTFQKGEKLKSQKLVSVDIYDLVENALA